MISVLRSYGTIIFVIHKEKPRRSFILKKYSQSFLFYLRNLFPYLRKEVVTTEKHVIVTDVGRPLNRYIDKLILIDRFYTCFDSVLDVARVNFWRCFII